MSDYLLTSPSEAERLQLQARVWEKEAEAVVSCIGIHSGWHCLDLGCGAMGVLGPLSRRVGIEGKVVGVDADSRSLAAARVYLQEEGLSNVELLERNVLATGLPDSSFDLVHERFVLPYIKPPEAMLQEMLRLARPGGWLLVQEPDNTAWTFYPRDVRWERFKTLLLSAFAEQGDIDIGQKTYTMMRELGLEDLHFRAAVLALPPQHPYMRMPLVAIQALRPKILSGALTTPDELDALVNYVEERALDPESVQVTFVTTQVWGRRPQTPSSC